MAYGTPRAALLKNKYYCVPCLLEMSEEGKVKPKEQNFDFWAYSMSTSVIWKKDCVAWFSDKEYEKTTSFIQKLLSKGLLDVQDSLLEGQYPDQQLLERRTCRKCHKRLREDCTDY